MYEEAVIGLHNQALQGVDLIIGRVPAVATGLIVFVLFLFLAKGFRRLLTRGLMRTDIPIEVRHLASRILRVVLILTGVMLSLSVMGFDQALSSILAGVGVAGLALGFAFRDIAMNFIAGVSLAFNKHTEIGDLVEIKGYIGRIKKTNFRETTLDLLSGEVLILPNKIVFENPIVNHTDNQTRRIDLKGSVLYSDDLDKVEYVLRQALSSVSDLDPSKEIRVYFQELTDSRINYVTHVWIATNQYDKYLEAKSDAIKKIKKAFELEGISVPPNTSA